MALDRRTLLQIIPAAVAARRLLAQSHCSMQAEQAAAPYQFQFFTPDEVTLVDNLMEHIIPADEHSPGAHAARAVEFADLMIATSPDYVKQDWRTALQLVAAELKTRSIEDWLVGISQNEDDPQTVLEIFFPMLKQMTINGYYSSAIGIHHDLHYQGNTYVQSFDGCQHPEHQS